MNYPTVNCSILRQNIVVYHKKTMFYYKMRHFTTESGIRAQEFIQTVLKYCPHPVKFCICLYLTILPMLSFRRSYY